MTRKWRRIALRGGLSVAALGVVALAAAPWWWPSALGFYGRRSGLSFASATTHGWSTVDLHGVAFTRGRLQVTARTVTVPAFGWWPRSADSSAIVVRDAVVTLPAEAVPPSQPAAPPSARQIAASVMRTWSTLQKWLPRARVDDLSLNFPARTVRFAALHWDKSHLVATGTAPELNGAFTIDATRPATNLMHLSGTASGSGWRASADFKTSADELDLHAEALWRENSATLDATFAGDARLPSQASLNAPALAVPAGDLGLAQYGPIQGAVALEWSGDGYSAKVSAQAAPAGTSSTLPPLAVELRANGGLHSVQIDSVLLRIPGVDANLSAPLVLALPSGAPQSAAEFKLDADLGQLPRSTLAGQVTGTATVSGGPEVAPAIRFALSGAGVRWRDADLPSLGVNGQWQPGRLEIAQAELVLPRGGFVRVSGSVDLAHHIIEQAHATAKADAGALKPWLPSLPAFADLALDAKASGPWTEFAHEGTASWRGMTGTPGGPIDGEWSWTGKGWSELSAAGKLHSSAGVSLPLQFDLARTEPGEWSGHLTRMAWEDGHGEWWHLQAPAAFAAKYPGFRLVGLKLTGAQTNLSVDADVQWPGAGRIEVAANKIAAERLAPFLPAGVSAATLESLTLLAQWSGGPMQVDGALRASYAPTPVQATYAVEASFRTESDTLAFGSLRVLDNSGVVLAGQGRLPIAIAGRADGLHCNVPADGQIELKLASTPNPAFWDSITRLTGWTVVEPQVEAEIAGTLNAPRGHAELTAASLQLPAQIAKTAELPELGDVKLVVDAAPDGLTLTEGRGTIGGHWVALRGRAPWDLWREWRASGVLPWRGAEFSFAADSMPMGIAARSMPTVLAPDGVVSFEMKHAPDHGFSGFLWLDGASLRPIPPVGAVRDLGGSILLDGYAVNVEKISAQLGGRPINITGGANVARLDHPVFDLKLESSRVPLVREAGLVLRAGLDLRVQQSAENPAHISGTIDLGRSVFVSDLISLLPKGGGVAKPENRPPFFSVANAPFGSWTLDVHLKGDNFLRLENPFLRGEISADFKLVGTLAEPRAEGRGWMNKGTIIFPFGQMAVQQAEVVVTPEHPFELALNAAATTRIYGYDVRLEVSGTAEDPRLQFSSEPPLRSQQVFLMLSAGEMPEAEHAFSTSERARRLAFFVGRNLASSLGLGGSGGDSDRLTVRSGEDFSREGGETLYVQYDLDGRWSLVAEKDRFDAYNFGIRFRLIDR